MAGNSGGAERTVRVVYEIDADGALEMQRRMDAALGMTSEAFDAQAEAAEAAERAIQEHERATAASDRAMTRMQSQVTNLAGGLNGLSAILGSESDAGALVGRMGHLAAMGLQFGSIFGPTGAVVGGIAGAAIPAVQSLATSLGVLEESHSAAAEAANAQAASLRSLASAAIAARQAASQRADIAAGETGAVSPEALRLQAEENRQRVLQLQQEFAERGGLHERIENGRGAISGMTVEEMMPRAMREEIRRLTAEVDRIDDELREREQAAADRQDADARAALEAANQSEKDRILRGRERGRGGRARARESSWGKLEELMAAASSGDGVAFAAGLEGSPNDPSESEIERARGRGRARTVGAFDAQRGAEQRAQRSAIEETDRLRKEKHELQLERIQAEVDAWTTAGQKIGSTLYNAFQTAASGQEDLDVAVIKGFKNLAIQFGGQMVNEGIAALLTAVGNTVANPPMAATKAAEGAGKLALGIGLGAAGAAIPVPTSGGSTQAKTPRLGPSSSDGDGGGGSVIVNMNAPAVVTGSRAAVGREIGGALADARNRFGRVSL